jgi:hypothetical protein
MLAIVCAKYLFPNTIVAIHCLQYIANSKETLRKLSSAYGINAIYF